MKTRTFILGSIAALLTFGFSQLMAESGDNALSKIDHSQDLAKIIDITDPPPDPNPDPDVGIGNDDVTNVPCFSQPLFTCTDNPLGDIYVACLVIWGGQTKLYFADKVPTADICEHKCPQVSH